MNIAEHLDVLLFVVALLVLLSGYPVAFALAGTALIFAFIGWRLGVFEPAYLIASPSRIFGVMTNQIGRAHV